jgi:hypothetical protein
MHVLGCGRLSGRQREGVIRSPCRKALVLGDPGDDILSFLSVIRSLGRGGIEVHVGWYPPDSNALWSRYVARAHELPIYEPDDERWRTALTDLMDREAFDLVIPCSDPSLIPLQLYRSELEKQGRIYHLKDEAFRIVSDKLEANKLGPVGWPEATSWVHRGAARSDRPDSQ